MKLTGTLRWTLLLTLAALGAACSGGNDDDDDDDSDCGGTVHCIAPGPDAFDQAQLAMIEARPGDVIQFEAGIFEFSQALSLDVDRVTVRGRGMEETVLDFASQASGAEGILAQADGLVFEDMKLLEPAGDGIKVSGAEEVTFRRIWVEWADIGNVENGAYGLYPVQSNNVLIEDCVIIGASDAGIYAGQSTNVLARRNRAEYNVIGLEFENCAGAEAHDNEFYNNTCGLAVIAEPNLPRQDNRTHRIHNNIMHNNNTPNFRGTGATISLIPGGTGMLIMAVDDVEVFGNDFKDNEATHIGVMSFEIATLLGGFEITDPNYDAYAEGVYIHDNTYSGGGNDPEGATGIAISSLIGTPVPHIITDGIEDADKMVDGVLPEAMRLCIQEDESVTYGDLGGPDFSAPLYDKSAVDCAHDPVPAVSLPQDR